MVIVLRFTRAVKIWNGFKNSIVMAFNIKNFKDHLVKEEVSKIIDEFMRYTCS